MQERKFKIVKLTLIALACCERCHITFQSHQRAEREPEREMTALFEVHDCEIVTVVKTLIGQPNAFVHTTDAQTHLIVSTCYLCGQKVASSDTKVVRIAERAHACVQELPSPERAAGEREHGAKGTRSKPRKY